MSDVTDLRDTRVLIPRARRALQGVEVGGSGFDPSIYSDEAMNAAVADAIANLLLYTGTFFGAQLEVVERDSHYQAPIAWRTSRELTEAEASLVAIQAALDDVYLTLVGQKQSETIRNEGQEWSWSLSANVLSERLRGLRADRDLALQQVEANNAGLEDWISFLAVRDARTSALIEPYTFSGGYGGLEGDPDARGFRG